MANGTNLTDKLQYEKQFKSLDSMDDKLWFIADQMYRMNQTCQIHTRQICELQNLNGKPKLSGGISGGLTGSIMAIIISVIEYFRRS